MKGGSLWSPVMVVYQVSPRTIRHVATAIVYLSFGVPKLRQTFVQRGALDSTLSMLRVPAGRGPALDFLYALEPLVAPDPEARTK